MIAVDGVTKTFADREVVKEVSFTVDKGEILGFLGPNGAGKTTTMRILTCFFPPTRGSAQVAGFDVITDSLEVRKRVGYMPENIPLYQDMPVDAYLTFVARVKGVPAREQRARVEEVIEECAIQEYADYPIAKISRGYRQRVGLAQAIIGRPDVLVLDEPTVGLDPSQIREIRKLIKRLGEKSTVILSTHILPEVTLLCHRIVIIKDGRIRANDTPENITAQLSKNVYIDVEVAGGEPSRVIDALKGIGGVERVSPEENPNGSARYVVEACPDGRVEKDIAACVVRADWGLLDLHRRDMSLEDIYMQITSRDLSDEEWAQQQKAPSTGKREQGEAAADPAPSAPSEQEEA